MNKAGKGLTIYQKKTWIRKGWAQRMIYRGPAFSQSYDLAPRPTHPPSPVSKLDRRQRKIKKERQLGNRRVGGKEVGEKPNHTTARKPGPL
jgi:hypothetical protein